MRARRLRIDGIETLRSDEEAAIGKSHFPIFEQVVEDRENVSLCMLKPFEYQHMAIQSAKYCWLVYEGDSRICKLPSLFEIRLGRVPGK